MSELNIGTPPPSPVTPTTAERLAEYRAELVAAGFPVDDDVMKGAAANPEGFVTAADLDRKRQAHAVRKWWLLQGLKSSLR